jgi:hypothetical protein
MFPRPVCLTPRHFSLHFSICLQKPFSQWMILTVMIWMWSVPWKGSCVESLVPDASMIYRWKWLALEALSSSLNLVCGIFESTIDGFKIWMDCWKVVEVWNVGPSWSKLVSGACLWRLCLVTGTFWLLFLLPGHHEVNGFAPPQAPLHDALPHHRSTAMNPADHGLKPQKVWVKINLSSFSVVLAGIGHRNETNKQTNNTFMNYLNKILCLIGSGYILIFFHIPRFILPLWMIPLHLSNF